MARAVGYGGPAILTIATHPDGSRYAGWPVGCIRLDHLLLEVLGDPADGTYRIAPDGRLTPGVGNYPADTVVRRILPYLEQARTPVEASPWIRQVSAKIRHQLIGTPDGRYTIADLAQWEAWADAADGVPWQLDGGPHRPLVWAPADDPSGRATAMLTTIYAPTDPAPPAPEALDVAR
ncbi:hypothetical protein [Sphaerisporangium album]|nr:hypothetical protein [Sphaerisporangium album]